MNYREIKRRVRVAASEHLYSLEIYDEFDDKDAAKVNRAILELQRELLRGITEQAYRQILDDNRERSW